MEELTLTLTPETAGYPPNWRDLIPEGYEVDRLAYAQKGDTEGELLAIDGGVYPVKGLGSPRVRLMVRKKPNLCMKVYGFEREEDVPIPGGYMRVSDVVAGQPEGATAFLQSKDSRQPLAAMDMALGFVQKYPRIWLRKLSALEIEISQAYSGCYSIEQVVAATKGTPPFVGSSFDWRPVEVGDIYAINTAAGFPVWWHATAFSAIVGQRRVVAVPPTRRYLQIPLEGVNQVSFFREGSMAACLAYAPDVESYGNKGLNGAVIVEEPADSPDKQLRELARDAISALRKHHNAALAQGDGMNASAADALLADCYEHSDLGKLTAAALLEAAQLVGVGE